MSQTVKNIEKLSIFNDDDILLHDFMKTAL